MEDKTCRRASLKRSQRILFPPAARLLCFFLPPAPRHSEASKTPQESSSLQLSATGQPA